MDMKVFCDMVMLFQVEGYLIGSYPYSKECNFQGGSVIIKIDIKSVHP
jgi:hypothetical protein